MLYHSSLPVALLLLSLYTYRADSKGGGPPQSAQFDPDQDFDNFFHFRTRPDIIAPRWDIYRYDEKAISPGYWFIAPYQMLHQTERGAPWVGPMMYDQNGELIWAGTPLFDHFKSFDLRVATVNETDMMTVIYPHDNAGVIVDSRYEIVQRVIYSESFDYSNMHDFSVTQNGARALVLTKENNKLLSGQQAQAVGQTECEVHGDGLKELDITNGQTRTIFDWNGTDHIGLDETTHHPKEIEELCQNNWDIHHFNSVDQFPDGDYLVSARHTDTLYKISDKDGSIVWRLGGVKSDFQLTREARFSRQHHARVHSQNETHVVISVFDNAKGSGNQQPSNDHSRGLILVLQTDSMEADLQAHFDHPRGAFTASRGAIQILPDNNVFMCWSHHTRISEHAASGRLLMEASLKKALHTYRAYKFEWIGAPSDPPNVYSAAFLAGSNTTTVTYVSWNGATEVAQWNLYESSMAGGKRKVISQARRSGFETKLTYKGYAKYVLVEAIDKHGQAIGTSKVVQTIPTVEEGGGSFVSPSLFDASEAKAEEWDDDNDSESWSAEVIAILANPIATFVSGFTACAVAGAVFWFAWRRKGHWWPQEALEYQPVQKDEELELDEDERDDGKV